MIVEGLLTSVNQDGVVNVAPMGPIVHGDFESLTLRPFAGSTTFHNLVNTKVGVFHVVDDVEIIAEAAIRRLMTTPSVRPAAQVPGYVLANCCRWFEFQILDIDTSNERSVMIAEVVHTAEVRPFRGFNRARHAVIEAAILATRVHILPQDEINLQLGFLASAVEKTGDDVEKAAFEMLLQHIQLSFTEVQSV